MRPCRRASALNIRVVVHHLLKLADRGVEAHLSAREVARIPHLVRHIDMNPAHILVGPRELPFVGERMIQHLLILNQGLIELTPVPVRSGDSILCIVGRPAVAHVNVVVYHLLECIDGRGVIFPFMMYPADFNL